MPIRLIKVSKNLNVGISTLVEFLHKKGIEIEANPNIKIEDEHYDILVSEFGKDKNIRKEATETRQKMHRRDDKRETVALEGYELPEDHSQKKTAEKDSIETKVPKDLKPQLNIVGSIDLDKLNKPKVSQPKTKETSGEVIKEKPTEKINETDTKKDEAVAKKEKTAAKKEEVVAKKEDLDIKKEKPSLKNNDTDDTVEKVDNKEVEISTEAQPSVESTAKTDSTIKGEKISEAKTTEDSKDQETPKITDSPESKQKPVSENSETPQKTEEKADPETILEAQQEIKDSANESNINTIKSETETKQVVDKKQETEVKAEAQIQDNKPDTETTDSAKPKSEGSRSEKVFRLHKNKLESNIVVKGSIDLSSINDRTRPPRKSRAQRKKERLERDQKNVDSKKLKEEKVKLLKKESIDEKKSKGKQADSSDDNTKKKRRRIRSSKVNIDRPTNINQGPRGARKTAIKRPIKKEVSEEDVQKQIKETLARLTEKRGKKGGARYRREKREASATRQKEEVRRQEKKSRTLQLTEFVTANDLANMMDVPVTDVISTCMSLGVMVAINQRLDAEIINLVAEEYGFKTEYVSADVIEAIAEVKDAPEDLIPRSPIVTVMGHVDHGKTSLLDSIRSTNVIAGEAGGITQHIGAYNVELSSGRKITFLDTPGHEAFTAMRARGAKVTDVAIIIIAADDSVMPQTVEAINHAGAAGVPIVFAINKVDKQGANPEKIKEKLAEMNYLVEDWGGKYQSQDISAKKSTGIRELLEKVLLEADLLELKANPKREGSGSIIESELDKGRGYVSTILVENGTLRQGDIVLAGSFYGRIKAMFNERNQKIETAGPSEPALILGLNGAPQAGDLFNVMETEQEARSIATRREQLQREQSMRTQKMLTLDDIGRRIAIGNFQQLNIIVKGDVDGSVEALSDSLIRLSTEEIQVNVIHKAVGPISESDVTLAAASDGIIIGFQVRPSLSARKEAEKGGIDIRLYSIIYDAIEEVTAAMEGMLSPDIKEEITGNVEVLDVFKVSKVGAVAGCMVRDGKIKRSSKIRLIRDGIVVFTGELDSLKRFKDDVKEVSSGYECGITIKNFNDIKVGDIIESYEEIEVKKTL